MTISRIADEVMATMRLGGAEPIEWRHLAGSLYVAGLIEGRPIVVKIEEAGVRSARASAVVLRSVLTAIRRSIEAEDWRSPERGVHRAE